MYVVLYLYKLLLQVFGNSQNADMSDKFRDMSAFCLQVSRLMVSEVRRRASNQSTEAASRAIALFLEIEASEEASNGWLLLTSLNLLAATADPALIQASARHSLNVGVKITLASAYSSLYLLDTLSVCLKDNIKKHIMVNTVVPL